MGQIVDLPLPRLGETMDEGRIGTFFKKPGERFRRGETLLEVESDKTTVEVPALQDGVLVEWLVSPDDKVPVEHVIARIEVEGEVTKTVAAAPAEPQAQRTPGPTPAPQPAASGPRGRASTAARAQARRRNIDLTRITGSGRNGRIQRADLVQRAARSSGHVETAHGRIFLRAWPTQGQERGTALLLHGLFADSQSFVTLARMLAAKGLRVIAPDLPGHGETQSKEASIAGITAAIAAILPDERVHLVGHSFGAVIACELASRAASLTLLAPAGCGETINGDFIAAMLGGHIDHALQLMGEPNLPVEARATLANQLALNHTQLRTISDAVAEDGAQKVSILTKLSALTSPVTAAFHRDDPVIPAAHALNLPPNVNVRFLPGTSHLPHWRAPELIAGLVSG
jgi:pyruvate dehydrogenase E2 component (dihydrolipoamide acetyltransferase)